MLEFGGNLGLCHRGNVKVMDNTLLRTVKGLKAVGMMYTQQCGQILRTVECEKKLCITILFKQYYIILCKLKIHIINNTCVTAADNSDTHGNRKFAWR